MTDQKTRLEIIYDPKEFEKLNPNEAIQYAKDYLDGVQQASTTTKAEIILGLAEKYKKAKYPLLEIKEHIVEQLENRVSERYVSMCLTEEFKRPAAVARKAGKKKQGITNTGASGQVAELEEPETTTGDNHGDDDSVREPLPDIQPSIAQEISEEYITGLQNQVKALGGEIPFTDMLAHVRIVKLSKQDIGKIEDASKTSTKEIVLTIDTRTQEIKEILSDKEYKKKYKS